MGAATTVSDNNSLLVCSSGGAGIPAPGSNNNLYGGVGGARTIRLDFATGAIYANAGGLIDVALAAGALAVDAGAVGPSSFNASGADFAELFANVFGEPIPMRRIVTRDARGVRLASEGSRVLGVTSERPGVLGNSPDNGNWQRPDEWVTVGLLGQVLVEVETPCLPGDFLRAGNDGKGIPCAMPSSTDRRIEVLYMVDDTTAQCLIG